VFLLMCWNCGARVREWMAAPEPVGRVCPICEKPPRRRSHRRDRESDREADRLRESLRRMDEQAWHEYKDDLARADRPDLDRALAAWTWGLADLADEWRRSDAGYPLGPGMPPGPRLRADGQSHREGWMSILRYDPCAYCGKPAVVLPHPALERARGRLVVGSNTVDHIVPASGSGRYRHDWVNYTAACSSCNVSKNTRPLLKFMLRRLG
jgi:5-methylcytosine-specific restriction endonuclease McrA